MLLHPQPLQLLHCLSELLVFLRRILAKWGWKPVFAFNIFMVVVNVVSFTGFGIFYNIKVCKDVTAQPPEWTARTEACRLIACLKQNGTDLRTCSALQSIIANADALGVFPR